MSGLSRFSSTHWAETSELSRVIRGSFSLLFLRFQGQRRWSNRLISRYSSQPRQSRKTALSRAATRANPIATWPSRVSPAREADEGDEREREADALREPRRRRVLELLRGREPWAYDGPEQPRVRRVLHAAGGPDGEQDGLDAGQHRGPRAGQQQDRDQHHGGDAGGELGSAGVDADGGLRRRGCVVVMALLGRGAGGRQGPAHDDTADVRSARTRKGQRRQERRQSDERTRQWSTARRFVSQVVNTLRG